MSGLVGDVFEMLATIQADLYRRALDFREAHTYAPKDYAEFKEAIFNGFAYSWWCGDATCEAQIKEDAKATVRCIPMEQASGKDKCIHCGEEAEEKAIFGRAY
jgi:prolyl-tRNA synthetase